MKQRLTSSDKSIKALSELTAASSDADKLLILSKFHSDAVNNGASEAEEAFKSASRDAMGGLITKWFYSVNVITIVFIGAIFCIELYNGTLGKGIITTSVILSLIAASVAQNASAFLIFAKYAFASKNRDDKSSKEIPKTKKIIQED